MDIRQLRYFLAIAEEKHITAAAKTLNMSQPPLSYQLKLLEEDLGVVLFIRGKDAMELTPEGRVLQQYARIIVGNFNAASDALRDIREGSSGVLHIGAIGSASLDFLPRSISRFLQTSPDAEFRVYEASSDVIMNLLQKDVVELGIVKEPFDRSAYSHLRAASGAAEGTDAGGYIALALDRWFDTDDDPLALARLAGRPLIVHRIDEERITGACIAAGFTPKIICSDASLMTSITWALHDLGVAVIPRSSEPLTENFRYGDRLTRRRLVGLPDASETVLIWKKQRRLSNIAQKYLQMQSPAELPDFCRQQP